MTTISESTKKAYQNAMKQLRKMTTAPVSNVAEIHKHISESLYSDSSKTSMYCAVKALHPDELTEGQLEQYRGYIKALMDKKKAQPTQVATEAQKEKMISWEDVIKVRETLKGKVNDYFSYLDYMIVCLYTMFPPRRLEYSNMKVVDTLPDTEPTENMLVLDPPTFIFVDYKTSSTYGTQRFPVPEDLAEILKNYVCTWDCDYLITTKDGKPMSNHILGNRIIRIFHRETGKDVGASMLRHIYITKEREGEKSLSSQKDLAEKMAHSIVKSMEYRFVEED